ncbi:MAG: GGDEF domain-containing protein [Uliginosibacterium sp.]|nr:GGDEF domain-containing protein [Uliginosibacterium sp.]
MTPRALLRLCVSVLILLSITLLVWQHLGMNLVLRIDAQSPYQIDAIDDSKAGGDSKTALVKRDRRLIWDCTVGHRYEWPFCELTVAIAPPPTGFDFSKYETVALKIHITGNGSRRMRLFMRNYDGTQADPNDQLSWKQNELQFDPEDERETVISLSALNVASWWLTNNHIPVERASVDVSSVPVVQLSTAGIREERSQQIAIDYVEFRGKWLTRGEVGLIVTTLWLCAGILFLIFDFQQKHHALAAAQSRQKQLEALNRALTVENERVGSLARQDPLTGALNRAGIRDLLWQESILDNARKRPLSLLCCDLDHFKRVNDSFGHDTGDQVLVEFVRLVRASVRQRDYIVRWGGEEFFLFCPDTPLDAAVSLAKKLLETVAQGTWPNGLRLTMSIGVATIAHGEDLTAFIQRTDAALYEAKNAGRNRVVISTPGEPRPAA